jgi:hypothetical protein
MTVAEGTQQATDELIDAAAHAADAPSADVEKRNAVRHPFDQLVAVALVSSSQPAAAVQVVRACDLSVSGIGVISRHMMHPGSTGAVHMLKSDGRSALLGVQVRYSRYVGDAGHRTGLQFTPLPEQINASVFLDRHGRSLLLDPTLRRRLERE